MSTARQGERGVSLPEQKAAIERFANQFHLSIAHWFEERETAAKRGRPIWNQMLKTLRKGTFRGVVMHKIDRSARNLKDWADLGEIIDQGSDVRFVNESLDLTSRGGRLSADIQAVVAADYVRNLREEAKKGITGRLKQGFYPRRAPIGYLNNGAAKPKTIDPIKGPLVRAAFELYGSGRWTIPTLTDEINRRGLRNWASGTITRAGMHTILRNPFYTGIMRGRASGETYVGNHESLISRELFKRVQDILHGRVGTRVHVHDFPFRRTITCAACGYHLIGELQKGSVYYRCHRKTCHGVTIREDAFADSLEKHLKSIEFSEKEKRYLAIRLVELKASWTKDRENAVQAITLQIELVTARINRLTDAYIDQVLEKEAFEERRAALMVEKRDLEDKRRDFESNRQSIPAMVERCVELAGSAYSLYKSASHDKQRELLRAVMSNCAIRGKNLEFTWLVPFQAIADRNLFDGRNYVGGPNREIGRTSEKLISQLFGYFLERPQEMSRDLI